MENKIRKHFTRLRDAVIIGYVDHNDVVHSRQFSFEDSPMHEDVFGKTLRNWRWDWNRSLEGSIRTTLEEGDWQRIIEHLTRKYRIQFWENGHHDIDHFMAEVAKEKGD